MRACGYVYNRNAASLRGPRSRVVGMVINDLSNPFFAELAIGIERGLRTSGTIPFLANTGESLVRQAEVVRSMREHGASGVILCPTVDTDAQEIAALSQFGMPVVLAIRRIPGAQASLVASDNRAGAERATRHLIKLGHKRLGFLGGLTPMGIRQDRLAGFTDAHRAAGLAVDPAWIMEALPTKDGGFASATALLARPDRPTAVLCFNDVVAIGAMLATVRQGLAPGRDLAVVGFDDTSEARQTSPALTTISVGVGDLGERAAQILLRQIDDGGRGPETYVGEARLVVRASCGADQHVREVA